MAAAWGMLSQNMARQPQSSTTASAVCRAEHASGLGSAGHDAEGQTALARGYQTGGDGQAHRHGAAAPDGLDHASGDYLAERLHATVEPRPLPGEGDERRTD